MTLNNKKILTSILLAPIIALAIAIPNIQTAHAGGIIIGQIGDYNCYQPEIENPFEPLPIALIDQFGGAEHLTGPFVNFCASANKFFDGLEFPSPYDFRNHFTCYQIDGEAPGVTVELEDQFGISRHEVGNANEVCLPAAKFNFNDGEFFEPLLDNHWKCYEIRGEPLDGIVTMEDQFGASTFESLTPSKLCNPAVKIDPFEEEFPPENPNVHLKCYTTEPIVPKEVFSLFFDQFAGVFFPEQFVDLGLNDEICVEATKRIVEDEPSSIHGMKFLDIDLDGVKDAEEPGLEGWEFELECNNSHTDTTTSMEDGSYWFEDIPGLNLLQCTITEILEFGWFATTENPVIVDIGPGQTIEDINFGNAKIITASKSWTHTDYNWDPVCDGVVIEGTCYDNEEDLNEIGFRPANINNLDDDVLADELPTDEEGKFLVNANVHPKNDKFQNTTPGAFYALTTVVVQTDVDGLWVVEDYEDCTEDKEILKLLSPANKLERAVKVAIADPNGDVTELTDDLYDGIGGSIEATNDQADVHIEQEIEAGSTAYVLVKFQDNLKGQVFDDGIVDVMCDNTEWVEAMIGDDLVAEEHPEASLRITNQE